MAEKLSRSGVESENFDVLSVDDALIDPKDDRLGYAPFAKHLAESICKMSFPGGFVIAVYGSWNTGKSTLLNFVIHYLKQKPEEEQPIIVPFNPWLFSGSEDLTRRFFDQLQSILNKWKFVPKGLKDRIADFATIFSQIPLPYAGAGNAVATLFDDKQKDASDLKEEVEVTLLQKHPRIVVTIDDIDRLDTDEIKKLFRVIKAFPSFTDVVYVLVFDREVVTKALAETQETSGEVYLDKVVQMAFELPRPNKTLLRRLFFEKISEVLADEPKQLFDRARWGDIYFQGIDHFITNSRDIARLNNTLNVTYPAVKGEVNPVDFVAIESLRVFCRMVYDTLRKNPKAFAGDADAKDFLTQTPDELNRFHNSWMEQVRDEDKEAVKKLLLRLFPKLEAVWGNTNYDPKLELIWRKQLRACSLEVFPIYFRLMLPEGEISEAEMKAILALAGDAKVFGEILVELAERKLPDGTTQVRTFLERLEDYTEKEIPAECIPSIVQALFDVGDRLLRPEDESRGMFDFGNDVRIDRTISQLLRRLDEQARFEVLKAMSDGKAVSIIVRFVASLGKQQGKYETDGSIPEKEWLVSTQHLKELEEIALKKVQEAARENSLLQTPGLPDILNSWREWTIEEEVKEWVQKVIESDEGLFDLLEKFVEKTFSRSGSEILQTIGYRLDPKWLEPYLDPSLVIDRVRNIDENSELTQEQIIAIGQFIQEYDMRQQEKNPDDPLAWEEIK